MTQRRPARPPHQRDVRAAVVTQEGICDSTYRSERAVRRVALHGLVSLGQSIRVRLSPRRDDGERSAALERPPKANRPDPRSPMKACCALSGSLADLKDRDVARPVEHDSRLGTVARRRSICGAAEFDRPDGAKCTAPTVSLAARTPWPMASSAVRMAGAHHTDWYLFRSMRTERIKV